MNEPKEKNQEFQRIPVLIGSPSRNKTPKRLPQQLVEIRLRDMVQPLRSVKEDPVVKLTNHQVARLNQERRVAQARDEMNSMPETSMPLPPIQQIPCVRMERTQKPFKNFCSSYLEKHHYKPKAKEIIVIDDSDELDSNNGKTREEAGSKIGRTPAIREEVEEEMESIPDGQGALLELEALEMWKEFVERDPSPAVEMLEVEYDRSWVEDVHIRSVEGQKEGNQGVSLVTELPDFLPLEEGRVLVTKEDRHEMAQDEDSLDPDFIPDGQEEWLEMERKAGRYYD